MNPAKEKYDYQVNQSYLVKTTKCERKLLNYEIRVKDGTALPGFCNIDKEQEAIIIRSP